MQNLPILSLITFTPLIGMLIIPFIPKGKDNLVKWVALISTLPALGLAVKLFLDFDRTTKAMQFVEGPIDWMPSNRLLGIRHMPLSIQFRS